MKFIKYNGDTITCSFHNETQNQTFREGDKVTAEWLTYSFDVKARTHCWMDFDWYYSDAISQLHNEWDGIEYLDEGERGIIVVARVEELENLLSHYGIQDGTSDVLIQFKEDLYEALETVSAT